MDITADFRFTGSKTVNLFADHRATLMFGKDWKNHDEVEFSRPSEGVAILSHAKSNRALVILESKTNEPRYTVSCLKNGEFDNPAPCVAALLHFHVDGSPSSQAHYSSGKKINPPDGTPATVDYMCDGSASNCWYVNAAGSFVFTATKKEIADRISAATHRSATALCDGSQEVVALKPGAAHTPAFLVAPRSTPGL